MTKMHDELISIIKHDHEELKKMFGSLEKEKNSSAREKLVQKIHLEIDPHMAGEEAAFYPALKKTEEGKEIALEALEEHHVAKMVLKELMAMSGSEEGFKAKASVLKELVSHHIEEEESKVFNVFKKVLKSEEAEKVLNGFNQAKSSKKKALEKEPAMA
jgi:hemerythrin-like domain-containing protein